MVCRRCGADLPRGARRCPDCGAPVPSARRRRKRRGLTVAALVAVLALVVLLAVVGVSRLSRNRNVPGYADVLRRYFTALEKRDARSYASTRPEAYVAYLTRPDGGSYLNYTVYINDLAKTIGQRMDEYAAVCGRNPRITYRVDQALDISPYIPKISSILTRWYQFPEKCVENALLISGSYTVKGSSDSLSFPISETVLLQIDGDWYFSPDIGQSWRE